MNTETYKYMQRGVKPLSSCSRQTVMTGLDGNEEEIPPALLHGLRVIGGITIAGASKPWFKETLIGDLFLLNGNPVPKFGYRLQGFERLTLHAAELMASGMPVVLMRDYNAMCAT